MLKHILIVGCLSINFKVYSADEYSGDDPRIPTFIANPENCPLNACELLRILSHHFILPQSVHHDHSNSTIIRVEHFGMEIDIERRVRTLERRLRAVEQPIWKLTQGKDTEWNLCTEGICRCSPATKTLSCWNTGISSIPVAQVIPMDITFIDLSSNFLSTLHKDTFRGLTHLLELDLSSNQLDYLSIDLLDDLDSLTELRLQKNCLENLYPLLFVKLRHLFILDISHNSLYMLPEIIFNALHQLIVIDLSQNKLNAMPAKLLKEQAKLEEFFISKNLVKEIKDETFSGLKLKVIDLSENHISIIGDTAFKSLIYLEILNIRNNRLTKISNKLFDSVPNLIELDLTLNKISNISENAFAHLDNLVELRLGQNSLQAIPSGLFAHLKKLTKLMLFSNNFVTLNANDFLGLDNVISVMLNNNILKDFDTDTFKPMHKLEKLRLDSNKLQYLPVDSMDKILKLTSVKLDKNPWHCDCRSIYLARWLRDHREKLWDGEPMCRGPGSLGGKPVGLLRYSDLCNGQWAAMVSLSPRLPVRKLNKGTPRNSYSLYIPDTSTMAKNSDEHNL